MSLIINPFLFAVAAGATPEVEFDGRNITDANNAVITTWPDSSGNARNGTSNNGGPTSQTNVLNTNTVARWDGGAGKSIGFSGVARADQFTVIAVVKCTAASTRVVFSASSGFGEGDIPTIWISSNKIELVHTDVAILATSSTSLSTSAFYTVAVTYDKSTGAYAFYLNGSADGSGTASVVTFGRFNLFGCRNGNQNTFLGDMAYGATWNSVLSGGELATRFAALRTVWAHY